MRLVSLKVLKEFCVRYPDAASGVRQWKQRMAAGSPHSFSELRLISGSVDYVSPFTIFNIAGNKYRLITIVKYSSNSVFIRWMLTHAEYDKWTKSYHQGKIRT
ncbi:type II toxin-antitoxin system HigB family toxin [Duganella sp. LjRoot269]|jgi:mRNA interferase HigB|uniref:type II toxin-antitoxin system HigB family toxin n=1 Tax=Duganella sp. LjRoot269 TaxID=3342305 RepID=UPI003ECFF3AF